MTDTLDHLAQIGKRLTVLRAKLQARSKNDFHAGRYKSNCAEIEAEIARLEQLAITHGPLELTEEALTDE